MSKSVDDILFRCSSLGHLMTEPREKAKKESNELSESAKTHCIDIFSSWYYERREELISKYLFSGNEKEESSITDYALFVNKMVKKSDNMYKNDYIIGHPDIEDSDDIGIVVDDIKSSYSLNTFLKSKIGAPNKLYEWQIRGYMWLLGAYKGNIRYILTNSTPSVIENEKFKLKYKYGESTPEYKEAAIQIEKNHIFNVEQFIKDYPFYGLEVDLADWNFDIPLANRVHTVTYMRDLEKENLIIEKVKSARIWIAQNLL